MAARNPFASSIPDIFDDPYGLVQSRRPARHSTGYYFIRNLLLVGAVVGGVVALYRNDVFRDLARRAGLEQRYLDAEKFLVGTPGWGTPRSMEPVLNPGEAAALDTHATTTTDTSSSTTAAALTATAGAVAPSTPSSPDTTGTAGPAAAPTTEPAAAAVVAHHSTPEPAPAPAPAPSPAGHTTVAVAGAGRSTDALAPVSFNSLPVLNRGTAPKPAAAEALPPRAVAPAPVAHMSPAPVAHAAAAHPAPADHTRAKAIKVSLDEDASAERATRHAAPTHAAPPPAPPPAPVATKPEKPAKPEKPQLKATDAHEGDNPLLAAVRGAVKSRPPKSSVPAAE